jgi:hypothetical protein
MVYEDKQKYPQSGTDGTGGGEESRERLLPPQEPTKVHAATVAGVPDSKRNPRSRLPRHSRYAHRVVRPATGTGAETCPAFYHALCSEQTPAAKTDFRSLTANRLTTMQGRRIAEGTFEISRNRLNRHGDAVCFSVLHSTVQTPRRALQTPISEAFGCLRHVHSPDPWDGYRPRPQARSRRSRSHHIKRLGAPKVRDISSRCRLRIGKVPYTVSRVLGCSQCHPNYTAGQASARWAIESSDRTLSSTNEKVLSEEAIWSALADRDGFQYVQTQLGFCRPGTSALQSSSGDPSAHSRSQLDDLQTCNICSIQSRIIACLATVIIASRR